MTQPSFNLVDEPWLPVVFRDGSAAEVSLKDAFLRAREIRELADGSPLATVALHRLLLAILHRVLEGPRSQSDWRAHWEAGLPGDAIAAYLHRWRHRFDLFDDVHPFYQVAGFATVDKDGAATSPNAVTSLDVMYGAPGLLTEHGLAGDGVALRPAQAARALVGCQAWSLGGGVGPTSNRFGKHPNRRHATQVGGIVALVQGDNLDRTLLLNTLIVDSDKPVPSTGVDRPLWECDSPTAPGAAVPAGYLEYLTLPCRAVRLLPERAPGGDWQVRETYVAQGAYIEDESGVVSPLWVKRLDEKRGEVALALRADRAIWRDASSLFGLTEPETHFDPRPAALTQSRMRKLSRAIGVDTRLRVRCFGFVNDKAKPVAWRVEDLPASIRLLDDDDLVATVKQANQFAEDVARAVDWGFRVCAETLLKTEQKSADKSDIARLATRMGRHDGFWDGLELDFRKLLLGLGREPREELLQGWVDRVTGRAREAYQRGTLFAQGSLARRLQATVAGESALNGRLRKLREPLEPQAPPESSTPLSPTGEHHA